MFSDEIKHHAVGGRYVLWSVEPHDARGYVIDEAPQLPFAGTCGCESQRADPLVLVKEIDWRPTKKKATTRRSSRPASSSNASDESVDRRSARAPTKGPVRAEFIANIRVGATFDP